MAQLGAMTFDAGGTLITPAEPVGLTYARFGHLHGIACDPEELTRRFRRVFASAGPLAFPGVAPPELARQERAWWWKVVRETFHDTPMTRHALLEAAFGDIYTHYAKPEAWTLAPDALLTLTQLRRANVRLAIVSNFDQRLYSIVRGVGLANTVDLVLPSTVAGAAKPAPAIFDLALRRMAVPPAAAIHVGDDVIHDVGGAQAAGMTPILLRRDSLAPPPPNGVRAITTLGEILDMLP